MVAWGEYHKWETGLWDKGVKCKKVDYHIYEFIPEYNGQGIIE